MDRGQFDAVAALKMDGRPLRLFDPDVAIRLFYDYLNLNPLKLG